MAEEEQQHQNKEEPIIIKKKKGHGGHGAHGGAWKVAYADFVTAMMAFFIVMWIMGQSPKVKESVTAYFKEPGAFSAITGKRAVPIDLNLKPSGEGDGAKESTPTGMAVWVSNELQDSIVKKLYAKANQDSTQAAKRVEELHKEVKKFISDQVSKSPEIKELMTSIKIELTKEGLRIELIESSESVFFEVGSANLKAKAREVLMQLANQIGRLPNFVEIEGHTDSRQYSGKGAYSNWDLSADRANAARRVLEINGLWDGQITKVTGYADRKLRNPDNPFDVSNRRISILVKQMQTKDFLPQEKSSQAAESKKNE